MRTAHSSQPLTQTAGAGGGGGGGEESKGRETGQGGGKGGVCNLILGKGEVGLSVGRLVGVGGEHIIEALVPDALEKPLDVHCFGIRVRGLVHYRVFRHPLEKPLDAHCVRACVFAAYGLGFGG